MSIDNKPLVLWVLKDATGDYLTWEPTRHTIADFHHMVDYAAYKKAVDALRGQPCDCYQVESDHVPCGRCEALRELGEAVDENK